MTNITITIVLTSFFWIFVNWFYPCYPLLKAMFNAGCL